MQVLSQSGATPPDPAARGHFAAILPERSEAHG